MKTITPYINFNDNCEGAFGMYHKILGGDLKIARYGELKARSKIKISPLRSFLATVEMTRLQK